MKMMWKSGLLALLLWASTLYAGEADTISLNGIFKGQYYPRFVFGLKPMKDGKTYCKIADKSIVTYDFKSGKKVKTIVRAAELIPEGDTASIDIHDFTFSPDETKIMFATQSEHIYRHSSRNVYYIYDIATKKLEKLSRGKQQVATFSPDGKKVGFVRDNNLFYKNLETGEEVQITRDGHKNRIIYGTTDWVYEEEFSFIQGFHWSPDSKKIAYYRFDESRVKKYTFPKYGSLYPKQYTYKYPKAGERNSVVEIFVYDLEADAVSEDGEKVDGKTIGEINPDGSFAGDGKSASARKYKNLGKKMDTGEETDIYIPRIKWTRNSNQLVIEWMNRLQNELKFLLADVRSGKTKTIYHETNKYYIDITDNLYFLKDGKHFLITSEKDGYNHLYLYDMEGNEVRQITKGKWEVTDFLGYDEKNDKLYFISTASSPLNREMYSINLKGKKLRKISTKEGWNEVQWNPSFTYFINTFSSVDTPLQYTICNAAGKSVRTLEDNSDFKERIVRQGFHPKEFFDFVTQGGTKLNGWMLKPTGFDPHKKYPVLVYVYGGPGSQTVQNMWGYTQYFWFQYLAQHGFLIVSVDNRGTGARGEAFKKMTYRQLGKYETEDQIEVAKYLATKTFVDENKIGIFGWSYGGYMSSLCMTKGADYFSTGIAVAPVTNWRYYDNIYTERYMGLPKDNADGYDNNSPIHYVDRLKGNFLLVHGTADDNVHFQNSMEMIMALTKANKQFDFMAYPNSNHGIYTGKNTRLHLYTKMTNFLFKHLR